MFKFFLSPVLYRVVLDCCFHILEMCFGVITKSSPPTSLSVCLGAWIGMAA